MTIEAGALPEHDDGVPPMAAAEWLESTIERERGGVLRFADPDARFGCFEHGEQWRVVHNISFGRQSDIGGSG